MTDQPPSSNPPYGPGEPGPSDPTQGAWGPAGQPPGSVPGVPPAGWDPAQGAWGPAGQPQQGWVFPPTGGYPPGAGPYGPQPWHPGPPVNWYPPGYGYDPNDPLVTPPGAGLAGWFSRCWGALRRGWRQLVPIMLLTQVLPAAVLSVISLGADPSAKWAAEAQTSTTAALPDNFAVELVSLLVLLIGGSVLVGLLQAVGWAAGSWVITQQAAGQPGSLDSALRYGIRRALGLWGWTLLISLLIGIGACFCVLPGIYLAFALSMAGPVYLFERHNPIGRSFRMFHDRLGLLLGRVALVALAVIVGTVIPGVLEGVGTSAFGTDPFASPDSAVGAVVVIGITAVLALPAHLSQMIGLLVTYAEQRAHEAPVNTPGLAAELG
ncbi:hypothetical protein FBZ33_5782 [Micromonospora sp. A202]|uniref:DUF3300 domain-containing protein n=1 Tax=Micromonospora sp. A202 TaxID=2572899 RepID=UPI001151824F|nr:DUF3300 domain-containing protein [Micromonospora sp. A202]TQJ25429.1 hypothetical protein FBZ33_5782 [Micromonospora sp. A202]